jgi:uncharacterized protein YndB with AHSA1/START domain
MEPIVVEFDVDCSPEHAFRMWTERTALWWPASHTVTGSSDLEVVFEPRSGGRIYERGPDGSEHEWGEVRVWDPPNRVEYLWHLFFDRSEGTDITLTFEPVERGTRVRLHQDGFDRLPDDVGRPRRDRTQGAWAEITMLYRDALPATLA